MQAFFEGQMERLGLEHLDYYWLRELNEPAYHKAEELQAFQFMQELKARGKVKHIGLSFYDRAKLLDKILTEHPEMEYVQLHLNYLDWADEKAESRRCYETAVRCHKPVIAAEPLKGGSLAEVPEKAKHFFAELQPGLSDASWAIRFAATYDNVMMVLSGMCGESQLADNISFMKKFEPLNQQEQEAVSKAAAVIKNSIH